MPAPNNLPQQLTSFIGREREIARVKRLLNSARLLTLTGTGGCGKTRLALQVAETLLDDYPDGVWFVDLAPLVDPGLLPQVVASSLGVREESAVPLSVTLIDYLRARKLLLLLDNCEHLLHACVALAHNLLSNCPDVRVLATSRQALGVEFEIAWRVPSLLAPDPRQMPPLDTLSHYEAVRLFLERALFRRPDFEMTQGNASSIALLCYRLDGIPLAIELAAARVKVLSVEQIVDRLDERFQLLTSGSQVAVPRQKTLRALMDWSYDLLSEQEKSLFAALSIFAGSFSFEAVKEVWEGHVDEYEAIEILSMLVDKSLVIMEEQEGEARYRLLETIRQYAAEKLAASGEERDLRRKHRDWYGMLAEASESQLVAEQQVAWLHRLDLEHDNVRAALAWSRDTPDENIGALRIASAMVWYWYFRGYLTEGRSWLDMALALPGTPERHLVRAKALTAAGALAYLQSDYGPARNMLEESLGIWRELEDKIGTAFTLCFLAQVSGRQGNPDALPMCQESLQIFKEIGHRWGMALALDFMGEMAWWQGDDRGANQYHEESLEVYKALGDKWGIALEISNFGRVALRRGEYELARTQLQQALEIQREVGDRWSVAWTLHNLGDTARCEGNEEQAINYYTESLALFRQLGDKWGIASSLHMLAHMAQFANDYAKAEDRFEESLSLFRDLGDKRIVAHSLYSLGEVASRQEDYGRAAALFAQSLSMIRELGEEWGAEFQFNWLGITEQQQGSEQEPGPGKEGLALCGGLGDKQVIARCLEWFAAGACDTRQYDRSARLFGAAEGAREKLGTEPEPEHLEAIEKYREEAQTHLGPKAFATAEAAGKAMPLDEAIAYAVEAPEFEAEAAGEAAEDEEEYPDGLTKREAEVLKLIASGMTDVQTADQLVVSTRTVQAHVRSIYTKLGIATRSGATRYAVEHDLV